MGPPKPKSKQQAMPSMLKSMQRSVTVASAAVDTALGAGTTGVGQRSSVVAASASAGAQERHSLLASDGMAMDAASPDRPGSMGMGMNMNMSSGSSDPAPKAKLMKMSSRHIRMKKMMDSIGTRLKLHARGDNIAFGRRDRADASGKSYNVEIPKNMIVLTLIAFFVVPLAFGLWVLFRQLFMSEETHSRYGHQQHHQQPHHSSSEFRASHHPDAFHVTSGGNGTATEAETAVDSMGNNATVSDGLVDLLVAEEKGDPAASTKLKATATASAEGEASKEEETQDMKASPSGDQDDAPKAAGGDNAVAEESEESDANGDNDQSSEEGENEDVAEEANAEVNGSGALPTSEVTKDKVEPPDSDDQEEDDDDSNQSEVEGDAGGDADVDTDKDSAAEEGLLDSNEDRKGDTETKDNADSEESEGEESLEKEEGGESSA